jgi:hypothetical protein
LTREKRDRRAEAKGDEFYFHSILEYKKESQLKSRETTYIPKVSQGSIVPGAARWQVQPQVQLSSRVRIGLYTESSPKGL